MFITRTAEDMGIKLKGMPKLLTDSQAGRDTVINPGVTKNTVHFERWLYYVREAFLKKKVDIILVSDEKQRGDDKTKVCHKAKFEFCRKLQLNLKDNV